MDGVIFDTERRMFNCWQQEAKRLGLDDIQELYMQCIGITEASCAELFAEKYPELPPFAEFRVRPFAEFKALNEQQGMPLKPGIRELLSFLKEEGYRIGLASSTHLELIQKELRMEKLDSYFDAITGGDLLKRSKPHPDIYLMACQMLGCTPSEAYAIEDSYNGIRSAYHAGMHPIMVPDMLPPTPEMETLSTIILPDLHAVQHYLMNS